MMIGGGGDSCKRADHGIGITEANAARFDTGDSHGDFGDDYNYPTSYSLNLWIKKLLCDTLEKVKESFVTIL